MLQLKELMLRVPAWRLAVAESLTCGHVQARIGAISGASNFFAGGITAYSLEEKVRHLGVDRAAAAAVNCVSGEVAEAMARGVCGLFGAEVGAATTGYAEPSPEQGVTQPFAWWAVAVRADPARGFTVRRGRVECLGATRTQAQALVADAVVAELVAFLREVRG